MKIYLTMSLVGPFILDVDGNIINTKNFKLDPKLVAKRLSEMDSGKSPKELDEILKEHKMDEIVVSDIKLNRILSSQDYTVTSEYQNFIISNFHNEILIHMKNMGLFKKESDYLRFLRETSIALTRERVRAAAEKRDRLIVHAIETIDDTDKTINLFANRLREFYGMHFPELVDAIENHNTFAVIVSKTGDKMNINKKLLVDEIKLPEKKAEALLASRETSMGSELLEQDMNIIKEQAKTLANLFKRRQALEKWMEEAMTSVAPNICGVVNPLLGARLISLAGSLKELAICPSSKIQILGAEKALYRTIKTGAPPPKHGVIYQDPRLNQAKWWLRGKIARVISGRLSIAARMDYFEAGDKSKDLAKELTEKIEEVKAKYPEPPIKQIKKPKPEKNHTKGGKGKPKPSGSRRSRGSYQKKK